MANTLGAFIGIESSHTHLPSPPAVLPKDKLSLCGRPHGYELDELQWGARLNGPERTLPPTPTPATPQEIEQSDVLSSEAQGTAEIVQRISNPSRNRWRVAACALAFFSMGVNDSASGALIPYIEAHYRIGYALISLIFIANALGFITAAPLIQAIQARWGRTRSNMIGAGLMTLGYISLACEPPFGVVVPTFYLLGFGMAMLQGMNNVFIVNLVNGTVILGFMHGSYGVGGVVAPLMATSIVSHKIQWSHFYFIPLSLSVVNLAFLGWSFLGYERESPVQLLAALERTASRQAAALGEPTRCQIVKRAMKNKITVLGALFLFAYQGAEVSISGWVISFLIHYRKGDPTHVGYVTSGFWAGITLGRFILVQPANKVGSRIAIVVLVVGSAAFQLLVWLVPNIIGDAVAVAIVGLLLGPVYPCATGVFSRLLPKSIQMSSLSFMASIGNAGGALAPFLTGLLAEKLGTVVLNPVCIGLFVAMEVSWLLLPRTPKRVE